jgi:hypothetical protein
MTVRLVAQDDNQAVAAEHACIYLIHPAMNVGHLFVARATIQWSQGAIGPYCDMCRSQTLLWGRVGWPKSTCRLQMMHSVIG